MSEDALRLFDRLADDQAALAETFAARHLALAQCGEEMRRTTADIRTRGWKTHEAVWNPCLFLNTVAYDLSILVHDLAYEREDWKRRFIARSLALVLYEVAEDIPAVFGRSFRDSLGTLGVQESMAAAVTVATKRIAQFWNQHSVLLRDIRIISAAHREHDAITLLETIERIDVFALLGLGLDLAHHLNKLGSASQAVVTYTASVRPPELP